MKSIIFTALTTVLLMNPAEADMKSASGVEPAYGCFASGGACQSPNSAKPMEWLMARTKTTVSIESNLYQMTDLDVKNSAGSIMSRETSLPKKDAPTGVGFLTAETSFSEFMIVHRNEKSTALSDETPSVNVKSGSDNMDISVVPLPAAIWLFGVGLLTVLALQKKRQLNLLVR